MKQTGGLRYLKDLKVGIDELQWLQAETEEQRAKMIQGLMLRHGLVCGLSSRGGLDKVWKANDEDDDGTVTVVTAPHWRETTPAAAVAVDPEGILLYLHADYDIEIPDDSTWYTLVVHKEFTRLARGTIDITAGSTTLVGTDTEFTRFAAYTGDGFSRGTRLRIDAADTSGGNDGTLEIDTVVSDTECTVREAPAGATETAIPFRVAGDFWQTTPADPDIHQRYMPKFELIAQCRDPIDVDAAYTDYMVIADVMRDSAGSPEVTIIDRRVRNVYQRRNDRPYGVRMALAPWALDWVGNSYSQALSVSIGQGYASGTSIEGVGLDRTDRDDVLMAVCDNGTIYARIYSTHEAGWDDPGGSGAITIGTGTKADIVHLPRNSGYTHACIYTRSGQMYVRRTADEGATWTGEVSVWNPTSVDPLDTADWARGLLLHNHRLLAFGVLDDNSGGLKQIRMAYSDDYGATWDDDSGAGYAVYINFGGFNDPEHFNVFQDGSGTIWFASGNSSDDTIVFGRSQDDTGLTWQTSPLNNGGLHSASLNTDNSGTTDVYDPLIFVTPDGIPAFVCVEHNATVTQDYLRTFVAGKDDSLAESGTSNAFISHDNLGQLQGSSTSGSDGHEYVLSWCQLRDGTLFTVYVENGGHANSPSVRTMTLHPRMEHRSIVPVFGHDN